MTQVSRAQVLSGLAASAAVAATARPARAAALNDLVAAAKSEKELNLIAGSDTFGGAPGMSALNDAFNRKFGLNATLTLTPGPAMTVMGSRLLTEYQGNHTASTAAYIGPFSQFVALSRAGALQKVDWVGTFPWVTRAMVVDPDGVGILMRTGPNGMLYNPNVLPPNQAPKSYDDLVDPKVNGPWNKKLALAPYPDWLAMLSITWGPERAKALATKVAAVAGGALRYGDAQPLIDGQFALMANEGSCLELKWAWESKKVPFNVVFGSNPVVCDYFQMGVPKNSPVPHLAQLFVGFMTTPEAQAITDKFGGQGSHLVPGTRIYAFIRSQRITLQDPRRVYAFFSDPSTSALYDELGKIIRLS